MYFENTANSDINRKASPREYSRYSIHDNDSKIRDLYIYKYMQYITMDPKKEQFIAVSPEKPKIYFKSEK